MNDRKQAALAPEVAAVQMVSGPDVDENLATAARLVDEAASQGARLVVLPEYFPIMGRHDTDKVAVREKEGSGPIQDFLSEAAVRHGIWLAGGGIPLAAGEDVNRVRNCCVVYADDGRCVARYDKIHLFGFRRGEECYDEAKSIVPGQLPVVVDTPVGRVGLSICYDLRFPELYRRMAPLDLILVPAAFTATTGRAHWEVLLRARAIENQCYLLASAQGGRHASGRETYGHSMLIDPWGEVLACLPSGEGVVCGVLDHARIAEVRSSLPALDHRVL